MDNRQTPLNINDMSLPNGGLFDILGHWTPRHHTHRVGRDVDIRTTRSFPMVPAVRNGVLLTAEKLANGSTQYRNKAFEALCVELSDEFNVRAIVNIHDPNSPNEHYHVYFY